MSRIFLFCLSLLLLGCGSSDEDKVKFAITGAEVFLNTMSCTEALTELNKVGVQNTNARYLQTLASAYACKADYQESVLYDNFVSAFTSAGAGEINFGIFTNFSTSVKMTSADDIDFLNLQKGIDTLLYAGGLSTSNNPSAESRDTIFGSDDALNINFQLFYMIIDQISKYSYYYGCYDGSSNTKGSGTARSDCSNSNDCFANYANYTFSSAYGGASDLSGYLGRGLTGSCTGLSAGHTDLAATNGAYSTVQVSRLCEGVVLVNNFREVFQSALTKISSTLQEPLKTELNHINDKINDLVTASSTIGISDVATTLSQSLCESSFGANSTEKAKLGAFFVLFFETLFR